MSTRRVFALADEEDFYACLEKGRGEHLDLGQVLAVLVHVYATTDLSLIDYQDFAKDLRDKDRPAYLRDQ